MSPRDPVADLRQIAYELERAGEATYRVRAFRTAAATLSRLPAKEVARRAADGTLTELSGVGDVTARCVVESLAGEEPVYLRRVQATAGTDLSAAAAELRAALRGDCHTHSDWSDGGSPIEEMALAAARLGHEYLVLTDHSPRLTVARGLSADRLRQQLDLVDALNAQLPPEFRILTGIEVDILLDGSLDQEEELLARLDVVVGSVHSRLRDESPVMTRRMLRAIENPHLDILGHCTGRVVKAGGSDRAHGDREVRAGSDGAHGGQEVRAGSDRAHRNRTVRPPSTFDVDAVIGACVEHDKALEINCRPDRLDPPKAILRRAVEAGCRFAVDTDAHAPGQLEWQRYGCERAALCGVDPARVVNTWQADRLLAWAAAHQG